jgi:hypothetical protein
VPFSFDTNLIIGLVNEQDRLHDISAKLFDHYHLKCKEIFACTFTALKETKKTLLNKLDAVIVDILPVLPKLLQIHNPNSIDFQTALIERFHELRTKKPNLDNFYKLLYELILEFFKDGGEVERIFSFLSELALEFSLSVEFKLYKKAPEGGITALMPQDFSDLMKLLALLAKEQIRFSDPTDGEIFYEIVINSKDIPLIFISDDEDFVKNAKKSGAVLTALNYDVSRFSFLHIKDVPLENA